MIHLPYLSSVLISQPKCIQIPDQRFHCFQALSVPTKESSSRPESPYLFSVTTEPLEHCHSLCELVPNSAFKSESPFLIEILSDKSMEWIWYSLFAREKRGDLNEADILWGASGNHLPAPVRGEPCYQQNLHVTLARSRNAHLSIQNLLAKLVEDCCFNAFFLSPTV